LPRTLLHLHLLLRRAAQRSRRVSLRTQPLNRRRHLRLIRRDGRPERSVVVDILSHHLDDRRKVSKSNKSRIETLFLRRIRQRRSAQALIQRQPVVDIQNLLRIRRSRRNLRQQRVRIERYRRQQLIQLRSGRRRWWRSSRLSQKHRPKALKHQPCDKKKRGKDTWFPLHARPHKEMGAANDLILPARARQNRIRASGLAGLPTVESEHLLKCNETDFTFGSAMPLSRAHPSPRSS
jgi:hypothetical protein